MRELIRKILVNCEKQNIELHDIEDNIPSDCDYKEYSGEILSLIDEGILKPVKSKGNNGKKPSIPTKFKIIKSLLTKDFKEELLKFESDCMNIVDLTYYYKMPESIWRSDVEHVIKIREYLGKNGFPCETATSQERSYQLVADEKWILSERGKRIIKRLGILKKLLIEENSEPAMFALNPKFMEFDTYNHLIVENKAIYYRLIKLLPDVEFSTVIFGAGWRVISCMKDFDKQFPFNDKPHMFYYFGDLDYEGISIVVSLSNIINVTVATPFYYAYVDKIASNSKTNQRADMNSIDTFLKNFDSEFVQNVKKELGSGRYWPQETFDEDELLLAWRMLRDDR